MSARRQSARTKARGIKSGTASVLDAPAPQKRQQNRGKPKGVTKQASPKAVVKSNGPADVLAAESDTGTEPEPDNSAQSIPHRRGLPDGQDAGEDPATRTVEPVGKKPKVGVPTAAERPRAKAKKPIPPRSPLPKRINRVVHPAKPDMPRLKRTSAEVAAAEAEKVELLRRLEVLDKEKKLELAEQELNEEVQDALEERMVVRHLRDLPDSEYEDAQAEPTDDVLEDPPVDEDEPLRPQDEKDEPLRLEDQCSEPETMLKVKKKKKPTKGETRKAVEAITMNLRREQGATLKRSGEDNHEAESRKRLKEAVQVTKPSGLCKNWQSRSVSSGRTGATPTPQGGSVLSDVVLGGLADEDADSERPSSKTSKGRRDATRRNEIIRIASSDSEVETISNTSRKISHANVRAPFVGPTSRLENPKRMVKSEPSFDNHFLTNDSLKVPSFVMADWVTRFLPTLYHILFCSEKPFHDFTKGSGLLSTVQQVVDIVHPNHTYVVTAGSKLYLTAYDRLVEKRSDFGARALHIVERFFKQTEYANNSRVISEYAKWATGKDGPGIWGVPSARGVSPSDENYVKPKDIFESQHMVEVLTLLIKKPIENSQLSEYGHPKGAVALAAAGIERAFSAFYSGQKVRSSPFSRDGHADIVKDYMRNLNALSERRWNSLLTTCGVKSPGGGTVDRLQTSSLESSRHALYIPSSP
ncbi:hypothetical protein EDB89DRAFT_2244086 [Lactarius sanguifluus]|nr:hypothetical protein EDB89DRAFT_2244086 [Lactarius sanguifluus]